MRAALRQERMVEFAFEGLRWGELIRWKIADVTMNNFLSTKLEGGGIYQ
jgi:starch-binding outer membrane protein, SusD/RagB family